MKNYDSLDKQQQIHLMISNKNEQHIDSKKSLINQRRMTTFITRIKHPGFCCCYLCCCCYGDIRPTTWHLTNSRGITGGKPPPKAIWSCEALPALKGSLEPSVWKHGRRVSEMEVPEEKKACCCCCCCAYWCCIFCLFCLNPGNIFLICSDTCPKSSSGNVISLQTICSSVVPIWYPVSRHLISTDPFQEVPA